MKYNELRKELRNYYGKTSYENAKYDFVNRFQRLCKLQI